MESDTDRRGATSSAAPGAPLVAAAQRRQLTVLFCDLVGSTRLAGELDPEDFAEVLARYQELVAGAIERYSGYTAQLLGDGVVACFGYPVAHEDDAERAVYAGLAILDGLGDLNARLQPRFGAALQVRIGCHTGLVVAGAREVGSKPDEFAMVGETPHIAARLQGVAEPGSIVVSDATEALIRGGFETDPLGERALAGVARPVLVHRVIRPSDAGGRVGQVAPARMSKLVGRAVEMEMLLAAWHGAREGRGALVEISGEPGIGKSRLTHALADRVRAENAVCQRWQCSRHNQSTALHPVVRMLENRFGLEPAETEAARLEKVRSAVLATALDPQETVPLLADLLALTDGRTNGGQSADPQDERTALLRMLQSLLVAEPSQHPMLLVIEDLQWADPTTMELLWRVVNALPSLPVLCVVTHRQAFAWPWRRQPGIQIEVGPLSADDVRELAQAAGNLELSEDVLARVCAVADGIPLFVEEMLKMVAVDLSAEVVGPRGSGPSVPVTLHGLLAERLDRLGDVGDVLDVAAVLGREFDCELLMALDPLPGGDLGPVLTKLAADDVLHQSDGPVVRCEFKHALLQEAAYSRVLRRRRHELHARVASTLVARFAERAEREPELVAHHWSCAAAPDEAAPYWHAAGVRALERAAFVEAANHFRRGLEALEQAEPDADTEERRADFLTHLGAALQAGHGYSAAGVDEAYAQARARWQATGNSERLAAVIRGQWMFHLVAAEYDAAFQLAVEMLELGGRSDREVLLAEGHLSAGMVHMYRGELEPARKRIEEAISVHRPDTVDQIYEAQGDTVAGGHAYLASVLCNLGHERESRSHSDLSLELAERVDRPVTRAQAWFMRSILHLSRSEPHEFAEWVERAHAYSVDRNIRYWRTLASAYANWAHAMAGRREGGLDRLHASVDSYLKSGARLGLVNLYTLLADLQLAAGSHDAAREALALAEEHMIRSGERLTEVELRRCKARVLASGPQPDRAASISELEEAAAVADRQGARLPGLRALTELVRQRRLAGDDASEDEHRLAALCDWFGPDSRLPDVAKAHAVLRPGAAAR